MIPIFPELPARMGVYTLQRLIGSHEQSDRYLAGQEHVQRQVIVEILRPNAEEDAVTHFVDSARARVEAKLPHVVKVLDSGCADGFWYITQDLPPGPPLSVRDSGEPLSVDELCRIVLAAAELYSAAERADLPTRPLESDMIFLSRKGIVNFLSPVSDGGTYNSEAGLEAMRQLGELLTPLLPTNVPGQTRASTLLQWMKEGYEGNPLDWDSIGSTAQLIRQQLNPTGATPLPSSMRVHDVNSAMRRETQRRRRSTRSLITGAICLIVVIAMSQLGRFIPLHSTRQLSPVKENYILCEGGNKLMVRPVSIGDYSRFLSDYNSMSKERKRELNRGMPESATDHTPDQWKDILHAATHKLIWEGREMSMKSPIVNVSYWDALAYARYTGCKLPSAELLQAALRESGKPHPEEWTASARSNDPLLGNCRIVISDASTCPPGSSAPLPQAEPDPSARSVNRSFRLINNKL